MTMSLLWYVLAGVLLGFAASTLWEWLYFRRKRLNWESDRVEKLQLELADEQALNEQIRLAHSSVGAEPSSEYASPGVFLESESNEVSADDSADKLLTEADVRPRLSPVSDEGPASLDSGRGPATSQAEASRQAPATATRRESISLQSTPAGNFDEVDTAGHETEETDHIFYAFAEDSVEEPVNAVTVDLAGVGTDMAVAGDEVCVDGYEDEATILERLAAELAQPPQEYAPLQSPPARARPVARSADFPDNLSKIKGIGDVYKFRLYDAGIYTWHQIAESDVATLRAATHAYPGSNVEDWPGQARELAEKHGRQNAYYSGPVPDDLTQIIGIGPVSERSLYRAGICTYEQLAGATTDELRELFPIAIAGDEPNFAQWIRLAIEYANRKS